MFFGNYGLAVYIDPNENKTNNRITQLQYTRGEGAGPTDYLGYSYEYDKIGNISSVSIDGVLKVKYYYDSQNQLYVEENFEQDRTYRYTYDTYGNIRKKDTYNCTFGDQFFMLPVTSPASTVNYSYGNTNFKDMLTSYGNTSITYDAIGNPLNWPGGVTLTWQNGRELAAYAKTGTSVSYTYGEDGLRTSKTVNGTVHNYYYTGGQLAAETWTEGNTSYSLRFIYDAGGAPYAVVYTHGGTSELYYYITNLQGDVTKIVTTTLSTVVSYTYDAWGNVLSTTGTLASSLGLYNPLRYRGYYYDRETGWYFLKTRYYDPSVGRFINADCYTDTGTGFLGYNMFAYCENNPVMAYDDDGKILVWIYRDMHKAVLARICNNYPELKYTGTFIRREVIEPDGTKRIERAYCDLYNTITFEAWELKHYLVDRNDAYKQLEGYFKNYLVHDSRILLKVPSVTVINEETFPFESYGMEFDVTYKEVLVNGKRGIIVYEETFKGFTDRAKATAAVGNAALLIKVFGPKLGKFLSSLGGGFGWLPHTGGGDRFCYHNQFR